MKILIKTLCLSLFWIGCTNNSLINEKEKKIKTYNMASDKPGFGYVNIDGQIYEKGTEPRDSSKTLKRE